MSRRTFSQISREQPITWAVIEWLQADGWPHVFQEAEIRRGLGYGRADLGAAREDFRQSVVVEVKAIHVAHSEAAQLFDARRAAEFVYFAAPAEVIEKITVPKGVGIIEAVLAVPPARPALAVRRRAVLGKPVWEARKDFLHALMRAAARRGRLDRSVTEGMTCPGCQGLHCPFWFRDALDVEVQEQ
jgi:hypothetical protein